MTDEELDALVNGLWGNEVTAEDIAEFCAAITTLRAQLAEANARADRAEAALAAQIEEDAGVDPEKFLELVIYAAKEAREKALREAAQEADELADEVDRGHDYGERASARILALIDKEKTE